MAAAEEEDGGPEGPNRERGGAGATFECNICLETAREAVVSVWIWDRVTRPPAGRTPSSCFSPSSSFSGCSVFELCLPPAHLQPEENQYWGSLLTLPYSRILAAPPHTLHFCRLRPTLATLWEGVGRRGNICRMGEPLLWTDGSLESNVTPSSGRGRTKEKARPSSLPMLCFPHTS
uniref:Ring finger protein 5 n=1 Tax=Sus scrofa TaxID=9823 RepID=A0A8D1X1I0_PIG